MDKATVWSEIYERMLRTYGPQRWWPAETPFEIIAGAILTQATAWTNVEKALVNLRAAGALSLDSIHALPVEKIEMLVYPAGYYRAKTKKLKAFTDWIMRRFGGDLEEMGKEHIDRLREEILKVYGIGEETADDILLYALQKPVFVIDTFTRRLLDRLGLKPEKQSYSGYQSLFMTNLPHDHEVFAQYHALIVRHAQDVCKSKPMCRECCLLDLCPVGQGKL